MGGSSRSSRASTPSSITSTGSSQTKRKLLTEEELPAKVRKKNSPNSDICDMLEEFADYEKNVAAEPNKGDMYLKASRILAALDHRVKSGDEAEETIKGIGPSMANKIDEFLTTGKVQDLEEIRKDPRVKAIAKLSSVPEIGAVKARELVKRGVMTIEDAAKQQDLTDAQRIGVELYNELTKPIPRSEMTRLKKEAEKIIHEVDPNMQIEVCGSYRRGEDSSYDFDIVLAPDDSKHSRHGTLVRIVDEMEKAGFVTHIMALGDTKFMGVCQDNNPPKNTKPVHRRIDIRLVDKEFFPYAVLYYTGPNELDKQMRRRAKKLGYKLSEYGLRPRRKNGGLGDPVPVKSEKDIFNLLEMDYVRPDQRA